VSEEPVRFYSKLSDLALTDSANIADAERPENVDRLAPSTCVEAEPFALRVLDDSMQPEFRRGCIIVIDPTGRATDGSYVLARTGQSPENSEASGNSTGAGISASGEYLFRQLERTAGNRWMLQPLNDDYQAEAIADDLHQVVGVIVQRAGTRRSYHKRYE